MVGGWGRVERPDAEIWYFDTYSDDDDLDLPLVVLLHGLAGHAQEWRTTMAALDEDHRLVAIEQRGHGSSTRRPDDVSRAAYVGDVLAVLDHLGAESVPLVGQSMGAHTAMLVAAAAPERVDRLLMLESGLGGAPAATTRAVVDWLASWPESFADVEEFVTFFGGPAPVAHAWATSLERRAGRLRAAWDAATLGRALAGVHERAHLEQWQQITVPALLVRGEHGSLSDREVAVMRETHRGTQGETRRDLEVRVVAGAGHDVHLQSPEAWIAVLRDFLAR